LQAAEFLDWCPETMMMSEIAMLRQLVGTLA
jgi:hypothetical protein